MKRADVAHHQPVSVLYLFSSNYRDRYLQDVLNVLCLPAGSLYHFRYERKWVHPDTWTSATEQESLPAKVCVVFVDRHGAEETCLAPIFHPVRVGERAKVEVDGQVLHVYFQVKEYAQYDKDQEPHFQNLIQDNLPANKRPPKTYASIGHLLPGFCSGSQDVAGDWQNIVSVIAHAHRLEKAVFWRMDHPVRRRKEKVELSKPKTVVHLRTGYEFDANSYYSIPISFFRPDQPTQCPDTVSLRVEMDFDLFLASQSVLLEANVRYDRLWIDLFTKHRTAPIVSSFSLGLDSSRDDETYLRAPRATFPLRIKPSWFRVYMAAIVIAIGSALIATGSALSGVAGGSLAGSGAILAAGALWFIKGEVR